MRYLILPLLLVASSAQAADRELCADRPGLGTPACTVEPGTFQLELGLADWTREDEGTERTDTLLAGDSLVRIGLDGRTEARIEWTGYGDVRERDRALHRTIAREDGVGELTLGLRRNLCNPDGRGFSLAVQPSVTLPVGGKAIGAGTWEASLIMPVDVEIGRGMTLSLSPELDAAADEHRNGHHLAYANILGVALDLTNAVTATIEAEAMRDRDPAHHVTEVYAAFSVAWQPANDWQLDAGVVGGLNHNSADVELALGLVRKF
ncbi:transporter [Sphingomonas sp. ID0503]|uniref:transporter n=1 Tax=Sphingomonas sp. ID0503 TaxID=3399691 RepID=UPI003AFAE7D0